MHLEQEKYLHAFCHQTFYGRALLKCKTCQINKIRQNKWLEEIRSHTSLHLMVKIVSIVLVLHWYYIGIVLKYWSPRIVFLEKSEYCSSLVPVSCIVSPILMGDLRVSLFRPMREQAI
jgi:hypothetical protein